MILFLEIRRLGHREGKCLAQGHTAGKWESEDSSLLPILPEGIGCRHFKLCSSKPRGFLWGLRSRKLMVGPGWEGRRPRRPTSNPEAPLASVSHVQLPYECHSNGV